MNATPERTRRYTFKNYYKHYSFHHYIDTTKRLDKEQQQALGKLLAAFPHCCHNNDWNTRFPQIDFSQYSDELLMLAANAHDGRNPVLHTVCDRNGPVSIIQKLIDFGARIDARDQMNKLAMHWAITNSFAFSDNKSAEGLLALSCLLLNGARADIPCYQELTPLQYAASRGYEEHARLMKPFEKKQCSGFKSASVEAIFQDRILPENCREISRYLFWKDARNISLVSRDVWNRVGERMETIRQSCKHETLEPSTTKTI